MTWSTGFRAPQAYDEDLHVTAVGGEGVLISLADGLKPEKSNSFSGSVDISGQIGHFQTNLLIEGFYTSLNDVFYTTDSLPDKILNWDQLIHLLVPWIQHTHRHQSRWAAA